MNHEVITACENICRDFSWLSSVDPRIVQGFLTLAASLIGSGTALYIAKRVYRQQKAEDTRQHLMGESRTVVSVYLAAAQKLRDQMDRDLGYFESSGIARKTADESFAVLEEAYYQVYVSATDTIFPLVYDHFVTAKKIYAMKRDERFSEQAKPDWETEAREWFNLLDACRADRESLLADRTQ